MTGTGEDWIYLTLIIIMKNLFDLFLISIACFKNAWVSYKEQEKLQEQIGKVFCTSSIKVYHNGPKVIDIKFESFVGKSIDFRTIDQIKKTTQ